MHTYLLLLPVVLSASSPPVVSVPAIAVEVAEEDEAAMEEEGGEDAEEAMAPAKRLGTPLRCSGERHVGCDGKEGKGWRGRGRSGHKSSLYNQYRSVLM